MKLHQQTVANAVQQAVVAVSRRLLMNAWNNVLAAYTVSDDWTNRSCRS